MSPLRGRVVLVTGAARGIGEAVAREVAARGGQLALVGLEPERLQALSAELSRGTGAEHFWARADVTDQSSLDQAVRGALDALGGIDVVVANAGIANTGTVATNPPDALARTVEVNLIGVMRTVSATLPHVLESRGHYLLVASAASFTVAPGLAAYCASKAGVESFGDAFRLEVAHQGVTVGTAHPIWIDTDLVRDAKEDLPLFRKSIENLPGPFGKQVDVQTCARMIVDGMEARKAKVFVPPSVGWVFHARALLTTGPVRKLMAKEAARSVPRLEEQVRTLGRAFGRHSTGLGD
ncbi:MAG: SDR family oxidoreductase [Actinomycetota bacterium]|nr:SDR family oxidoreductase [Actinomycetota bacterium]